MSQHDFMTEYMDGSKLLGYVGSDIVQLGPFFTRTNFGCIERDKVRSSATLAYYMRLILVPGSLGVQWHHGCRYS